MKYEPIEFEGQAAAEAAIARDEPAELLYVPLAASMPADDGPWAEGVCARLAAHQDGYVRGSAIEGFGHLARRFGTLDRMHVAPILARALRDPDPWVRGKAHEAADDIEQFLGWRAIGEA